MKQHIGISTASLILAFVLGNRDPHTLSTLPSLLSYLPFPLVLYHALSQKSRAGDFTFWAGWRAGERVVRWSAVPFATFSVVYADFWFEHARVWIEHVAGFGLTLVVTWVVGVVFAALCAALIDYRRTDAVDVQVR